jgi:hypothetical protein
MVENYVKRRQAFCYLFLLYVVTKMSSTGGLGDPSHPFRSGAGHTEGLIVTVHIRLILEESSPHGFIYNFWM